MNKENYKMVLVSVNTTWSCGTVGKFGNAYIDQVAGYLRNFDYLIDLKYYRKKVEEEQICADIQNNYDFYGFIVTETNYKKCTNIAKEIKHYNPNSLIVFYGSFPTIFYKEIFNEVKELDYIVLGDGEKPTKLLIEKLLSDRVNASGSLEIPYIASRYDLKDKRQYFNDEMAYLPAMDFYENDSSENNAKKIHRIQTKNSVCSGSCTFCSERHGKIVYKDTKRIIEEIKLVHEKYGVRRFFFNDNNLFDPNDQIGKNHVWELCSEIEKLNFKASYQCYCKASSLQDTPDDHKILSLMKKVGFNMVFVGVESGNQEDLELYNKLITIENSRTTISMLKSHGLFPILGFIGFNPYTTKEKIRKNFDFLCELECSYLSNYLYSFVNIDKYTGMYEYIKRDGLLKQPDAYFHVDYDFADKSIIPLVNYIREEMQPKTFDISYEVDDVYHTYLDCKVWNNSNDGYLEILNEMKLKDFEIIKKYLSILFVEFDIEKFRKVENNFWNHFEQNQNKLREIMAYINALYRSTNKCAEIGR